MAHRNTETTYAPSEAPPQQFVLGMVAFVLGLLLTQGRPDPVEQVAAPYVAFFPSTAIDGVPAVSAPLTLSVDETPLSIELPDDSTGSAEVREDQEESSKAVLIEDTLRCHCLSTASTSTFSVPLYILYRQMKAHLA